MKTLIRIASAVLALAFSLAASAGTLTAVQRVHNDPSIGQQFPEIAYRDGVIHVVWVGYAPGKQGDIFYARSTVSTGTSWSAAVNLTNNATGAVGNNKPQVTAHAGGVVVVGWNSDDNTGAIYTARSTNGGVSFSAPILAAGADGGGYSRITDLLSDSAGRVHMAYYTSDDVAGVGHVHHRMSCDNGASWSTDVAVTSQILDGDVDNEVPRLAESGGRMYIVFRSSRNGNPQGGWAPQSIQMQSGVVSGCQVTWSYPARRIGGGIPFSLSSSYRPDVYADSSNRMHLAWWDNDAGAQTVYRNGAPATGAFGPRATISNFGVDHPEPGGITSTPSVASGGYESAPAIVSNGTTAFIGYARNTTSTAGLEHGTTVIRESTNNGTTWGAEAEIASAGATPRFAIDNSNTQNVGVVFTDLSEGTAKVKYRLYTLGSGGGPLLSMGPDPATFGNLAVGGTSATINITVSNTGSAGSISGVALTGARPGDYSIVSNSCTGAIAAAGSCVVGVRFVPKAIGTRTAQLTVTSNALNSPTSSALTGNGTASGTFATNVNAIITGYYQSILGRDPDAGGANFWASEANRMVGLGNDVREVFFAMSISFFNSAEYASKGTSDTQYITDLYRTFFVREPDAPGLAFWQSYLDQGVDRGALLTNFLFSTEFSNFMTGVFGTPPAIRPEVNMTIDLYRGILGGLPDSGGFNFWLGQIRTAQCQSAAAVSAKVGEIAGLFVNSAEYANREAQRAPGDRNRMHIGDLYNAFLRRGAEPSGYNFWAGQLNSAAQTRDQVRAQYLQSTEFQQRVNAVIAAGCAT